MSQPPILPHGPITRVVDGIYVVRGSFQMGPAMRIGRTMTVVEQSGGLVVLNAIRLSAEGESELERLGPVRHLVKLSDSHGIDEPYYASRYKPEVWALEGAKLGEGLTATKQLGPACPIEGGVVLQYPGATGWRECALWLKNGGGTLITCDALQNHVDSEGASLLGRVMTSLLGFKGGVIVAPMWRKYQKLSGAGVRSALAQVAARGFENLATGHGPAIAGGADGYVRDAIEQAVIS
jgi:hypothetical protein